MPRRKYPYRRSDETYEVVRNHVGEIAKHYPCDASFIYAVKNGDANDPYPAFRHLFQSAALAGAPVETYLRDLRGLAAVTGKPGTGVHELAAQLADKISADSDSTSEILAGIRDNELDRSECHRILDALDISRQVEQGIRRLVEKRLGELTGTTIRAA